MIGMISIVPSINVTCGHVFERFWMAFMVGHTLNDLSKKMNGTDIRPAMSPHAG